MRRSNCPVSIIISTETHTPLIIGHRGASTVAPENTLAAFTQALSTGADGIELDVRLASDGVPVVIHDATLRRTGLMRGSIYRLDSKQLVQVDVGTWFNQARPELARAEYIEERIPTLAQVFDLCRNMTGTIYVEMKSESDGTGKDLALAVAKVVKAYKFHDRAVVISFSLPAVASIKKIDSSIRTGALFGSTQLAHKNSRENILAATADCGAEELVLNRLLVRRKFVEKAHEANLPVVVWTVDDANWVKRARRLKLRVLMTNHPAKLLTAR